MRKKVLAKISDQKGRSTGAMRKQLAQEEKGRENRGNLAIG